MKYFTVIGFVLGFPIADFGQDLCVKARSIVDKLNATHFQSQAIDDSLSNRIFEEFFLSVDADATYFTERDIASLSSHRFSIDDEINSGSCGFVQAVGKLYREKIRRYHQLVDSVLRKPVAFNTNEFGLPLGGPQVKLSKDDGELRKNQVIGLKVEILIAIFRQSQMATPGKDLTTASFKMLEEVARKRVMKRTLAELDQLTGNPAAFDDQVAQLFLKTLPLVFDPHSAFFSKQEVHAFEQSLNPEGLTFGFDFEDGNLGDVRVSAVAPGGPAWKSNRINKGDVIIGLSWGNGKHYDIQDYDADGLSMILRGAQGVRAEFTLRKATGEIATVSLIKEKMQNRENIISSFILKGDRTIGYINLPGFFTDSEEGAANGCANEVAREILKLKGEKIEALILDLRFNGGGSAREAIGLSGIFIDSGPLAVFEERDKTLVTLKDMNKGMAYDGPLVIMVNGISASASELTAAALQDYNRALIVGSPTYGKATAQVIVPVENSGEDFLKVTVERIYRIDGKSIQRKGVTPDFALPDPSDNYYARENDLRYSLPPETIHKKTYYAPWRGDSLSGLKEASARRVAAVKGFSVADRIGELLLKPFPLEENLYVQYVNELGLALGDSYPQAIANPSFVVTNNHVNASLFEVDSYRDEINKELLSQIQSSLYVNEAYQILADVLNSKR